MSGVRDCISGMWRLTMERNIASACAYVWRKKLDQEDGEAFWAGVYDVGNKRSCGNIERKTSQMGDGYEWYDVAEWIPDTAHYFWIGPGRFDKKSGESSIKALYIDKLELSRVEQ